MRKYGNEIEVSQGEDWNLDIELTIQENNDIIPYIVSNRRQNAYFVITIASTKFEKNLRYVKSWWNNISGPSSPSGTESIPTFYSTRPVFIEELEDITSVEQNIPATRDLFNMQMSEYEETPETRCLYVYTLNSEEIDSNLGHKPYHYFYYDELGALVLGYECYLRQNFSTMFTKEWVSQNYLYQITLVDGPLLEDVLDTIARSHNNNELPEDWPDDIKAQYHYVKVQWPNTLEPDIDEDSMLGRIDNPEVILGPTKLTVSNNLRKLI